MLCSLTFWKNESRFNFRLSQSSSITSVRIEVAEKAKRSRVFKKAGSLDGHLTHVLLLQLAPEHLQGLWAVSLETPKGRERAFRCLSAVFGSAAEPGGCTSLDPHGPHGPRFRSNRAMALAGLFGHLDGELHL